MIRCVIWHGMCQMDMLDHACIGSAYQQMPWHKPRDILESLLSIRLWPYLTRGGYLISKKAFL